MFWKRMFNDVNTVNLLKTYVDRKVFGLKSSILARQGSVDVRIHELQVENEKMKKDLLLLTEFLDVEFRERDSRYVLKK